MISYKKLVKLDAKPTKQMLKDCKDAFMLINGKIENECLKYASSNKIDELVDNINKYYSTRIASEDKKKIIAYIKKNKRKTKKELVNDLANSNVVKTSKNYKSVATKIVYFLSDKKYPIYDSNAYNALIDINKKMKFNKDLDKKLSIIKNKNFDYDIYKGIIDDFAEWCGIKHNNYQAIDKYLWTYGRNI